MCLAVALAIAGCGSSSGSSGHSESSTPLALGGPTMIALAPPAAIVREGANAIAEFDQGRAVAAQSGCLACHRIGEAGNDGPGPDLTEVGARLPARAIERTLTHPTEPMPAFTHLPPAKFHALVAFLSALR